MQYVTQKFCLLSRFSAFVDLQQSTLNGVAIDRRQSFNLITSSEIAGDQ
jgi:hypothetical protein